ncbi:MAG: hypothetical protein E6H79_16185 [Betaproteobacteria bacterium]|nr:MAG: hypothetical protein E6H79_16185 [Betaproteobacteria bacterium]
MTGSAAAGRAAPLLIALSALAVLLVVNLGIGQKERLIAHGQAVFVALAPVDPRSLMQGDYMRLNFNVPQDVARRFDGLISLRRPQVVARRDQREARPARADELPGRRQPAVDGRERIHHADLQGQAQPHRGGVRRAVRALGARRPDRCLGLTPREVPARIAAKTQSTVAPDAFTTCAHFFVSAPMNLPNSAPVIPLGIAPCDSSRSFSAGAASA